MESQVFACYKVGDNLTHESKMNRILVKLIAVMTAFLLSTFAALHAQDVQPLPVDQAFTLSAHLGEDNQLIIEWNIAPGYFMYQNAFHFAVMSGSGVKIGSVTLPEGVTRQDQIHGKYQVYFDKVRMVVPYTPLKGQLNLNIDYRGCSSEGFCYTPVTKNLSVNLAKVTSSDNLTQYVKAANLSNHNESQTSAASFFAGKNIFVTVLSFLGLGLLLAFTPCVLPMVPILSGLIIGQGKTLHKKHAFTLSLAYVLGMALTYAIAGIVIALIGSSIQAELQRPWVIILFCGVFVLLALSLLGLYELQLPSRWQRWITSLSNRQQAGQHGGVFLMGCLSTLIVSPCVSAPLVGVLAYIGETGDVFLGAISLLALGIGMGIPLLLVGISAGRLLPKAGHWMALIERIFGIVMLGIAIWMLSRMTPGPVTLFLWAALCLFSSIYFIIYSGVPSQYKWLARAISTLILIYGIVLVVGAIQGNADPLRPWAQWGNAQTQSSLPTTTIRSMSELNQQLSQGKPVMLDFYADWCTSCVVMDRTVFTRADVQQALQSFHVLRVDLTANNAFDRAILKRFNVIGPPTILFFDRDGRELTAKRIVGEVNAKEFLRRIPSDA